MITKFTEDMDIIAALDDLPNAVGGLTAAQLKAKFDEGGKALKNYINNILTAELGAYSPPHIEKNWDFLHPINQRHVTTWQSRANGIDCWTNDGGVCEITEDGLSLGDKGKALQYFPFEALEIGETYTLSVRLHAPIEHVASGYSRRASIALRLFLSAYASQNTAVVYPADADENNMLSVTFVCPETTGQARGIMIDGGKNFLTAPMVVEAVKLEKGSVSTLHLDGRADPNIELWRCQQRVQVFADANLCPTNHLDFRPVMDADPIINTITIDNVTYTVASCEIPS